MFRLNFPDTSPEDFKRSAVVAKFVELINLRMTKGVFGASPKPAADQAENATSLPPYQFQFTSRFDEKENQLDVSIVINSWDLRSATGEGAGADGLHVEAGFLLTYKLMVEPPPEDLRSDFFSAFARVNGLMNVWPYYREFAHEIARRMGFPSVLVPLLRAEAAREVPKPGKASKKKPATQASTSKAKG